MPVKQDKRNGAVWPEEGVMRWSGVLHALLLLAACVPKSAFGPPVLEVSLDELKANAPVGRLGQLLDKRPLIQG